MNSETASYWIGALKGNREITQSSIEQRQHLSHKRTFPISEAPLSVAQTHALDSIDRATGFSDEALVEGLCVGDQEALGVLFRRYARIVRAVAYRILRNASEADDLLQEVFLFIFRKANLFDAARGSARSWIIQVTYHRAIDRRRYLVTRHFYTVQDLENVSANISGHRTEITFYEQSIEGSLGKEMLRKIEESLTEDQRKTIRLYFFEGYALEELAELFGQTLGNVRNHYYRGLEKMRKLVLEGKAGAK